MSDEELVTSVELAEEMYIRRQYEGISTADICEEWEQSSSNYTVTMMHEPQTPEEEAYVNNLRYELELIWRLILWRQNKPYQKSYLF